MTGVQSAALAAIVAVLPCCATPRGPADGSGTPVVASDAQQAAPSRGWRWIHHGGTSRWLGDSGSQPPVQIDNCQITYTDEQ